MIVLTAFLHHLAAFTLAACIAIGMRAEISPLAFSMKY